MADPRSTSVQTRAAPATTGTAIKETLESVVIAFVLAFVFRAYVVEAFVIPTGSMAPTLLGQHWAHQCRQCGFRFTTEVPGRPAPDVICPMCLEPNPLPRRPSTRAGDRILVHKYVYELAPPRRWDVVVFKNPNEPEQNYIKRLVGLPGEDLLIIEGNVYVKPSGAGDEVWHIARKTDRSVNRHAIAIQRALWRPLYNSRYVPRDGGSTINAAGGGRTRTRWTTPWDVAAGQWSLGGQYRYRHDGAERGRITFDFQRQRPAGMDWYPYNQFRATAEQPIEDVRVAAAFEPDGAGLSVAIETTARLDRPDPEAGPLTVALRIAADGTVLLTARDPDQPGGARTLAQARVSPFPARRATRVELWYVDQEASAWVDGRCVCRWSFELDMATLLQRPELDPDQYPAVAIEVEGTPVNLLEVEADRDLAYTSAQPNNKPGLGTVVKHRTWGRKNTNREPLCEPVHILEDQYFCLGDNSPLSHDGRFWDPAHVDPWVRRTMLPDPDHHRGVVPARLLIGRAFFVYFPAAYPALEGQAAVLPNFGDMRFIH